ncbi:MAG TPA: DUF433 domain-containing protein [Blastocatellia bacterium]|nr:DUF433 domain-containing protein [Blastocatellia bacterium]HMV86831.1 DUF433 domain-containing protein [Blastocatellia bacterium]HMX27536.1 DUF433 domain-containing protein [Blastocatellia bacterium]HMY71912.1 DUF433 domain-containing protein [Blastocatellia bacterium]HMZ17776.1 DUF433 domain-containing protein [Blastocatellia bacterium]
MIGSNGTQTNESKPASFLDRITFNPNQCGGRPCIRGMRIRVSDVLGMMAAGASEQEILEDFPYLEPEDLRACLEYAAAQVNHAVVMAA